MTSTHTASGPQLNYRNMYDVADYRTIRDDKAVPITNTILDMIHNHPDFTIFLMLVQSAKLENYLNDPMSTLTLFLPTNESFNQLSSHLVGEFDLISVRDFVSFHILKEPLTTKSMQQVRLYVRTLYSRENLHINGMLPNTIKIGLRHFSNSVTPSINYDSNIIQGDIMAQNGIIHVISSPLIPES
jgi:uncharacterized surface protein with fasciclin (FAS1) repeats